MFIGGQEGHKNIVQLLLDAGADIETRDDSGDTPLIIASYKGRTEVVKLLVDAGADIEAMDDAGDTPLYTASEQGHAPTVQLLLSKGAQVNHKSKEGYVNYKAKQCILCFNLFTFILHESQRSFRKYFWMRVECMEA